MARSEDKLSRWLVIVAVIFILAAVIWKLVPKDIIYASIGIGVAMVAGVSYLVYRKRGLQPFKNFLRRSLDSLAGKGKTPAREFTPQLLPSDFAKLRNAVGNRCENPSCRSPFVPTLVPHHIIPRHKEGSSNRLRNLLVVCENCHRELGRGVPNQDIQLEWARNPNRFRYDLKRQWRYGY